MEIRPLAGSCRVCCQAAEKGGCVLLAGSESTLADKGGFICPFKVFEGSGLPRDSEECIRSCTSVEARIG